MNSSIKILTIEDDPNIIELIDLYMVKMGYQSIAASDGEMGLEMYFHERPDCIILDLMLPKVDGWDVCKTIRLEDKHIPILMLTGKGESYDIVQGLELGADDYIVKPFDPNELCARVKAALRRTKSSEVYKEDLTCSNLVMNMQEYKVFINNEEVKMPPKETELLYFFASHPNQILSRQQLLDRIWGYDFDGDPRTIDVHIKRVRDKLTSYSSHWSITTVRGIGYRFEDKQND
ncbi:phosphate regulon transcriptional regulatory protein PhoB [Halalkalibacter wakoensis JCM 9140]|uniref:Phosphate regulon transcriptional regulatory protein PhoB n=1 Tax=Halalkalibacter wakoensis JCM 9140 TaxID=1236970 RepID=W4Q5Q1_9BACI|nr:response regulator transcription factor [Halalkalibacter wakoensis]GAE27290.1 phosphate regulon transcriptional regulatory protein PhoB [Halalkalibacter wakoensis JCM 9140]